jgi:cytochrome c-type biogenesis protein CcmH/NrfG
MFNRPIRFAAVLALAAVLGLFATGCDQFMSSALIYLSQDPPAYDKAIEQLKEGLTVVPENGNYYRLLAQCYFSTEKYKESHDAYENALKFLPDKKDSILKAWNDNYDELYRRAATYANRSATVSGDSAQLYLGKAAKTLEGLFAFMPERDGNYMMKAFLAQRQNKPEEVKRAYIEVINLNPKNTIALSSLGVNAYNAGNYDEAIGYYRKVIAVNPADTVTYTRLGLTYFAQNKFDDAIEPFRMAAMLDSTNRASHLYLATAIINDGKNIAPAVTALEKALRMQEDDETLKLLGVAALREKDYDRAINAFKRATELKPDNRDYWGYLRDAYSLKGDKAKVKELDARLKKMP